ncbi:MAG: ribose 5-phosphate isomerase B [Candidatus Omnitrophota bacterium]
MDKRIAIGCDHGGFKLKELLKEYLSKKGFSVNDFGTHSERAFDYPLVGYKVARSVASGKDKRGILICKSGIGMAIIANKVRGVRSGVCNTIRQARSSRMHNDTNVLSLAAEYVNFDKAKRIVGVWLNTASLGDRHRRRVNQIKRLEKRNR